MKYRGVYYPSPREQAESQRFIYNISRQISIAFNNRDMTAIWSLKD